MAFNLLDYFLAWMPPRWLSSASPWVPHVPVAFALVHMLRPSSVVEVGTRHGDSYTAFCQAAAVMGLQTSCLAVCAQAGPSAETPLLADLKALHAGEFGHCSKIVSDVLIQPLRELPDGSVDLLHLDVPVDQLRGLYDLLEPKLSPKAVVLLHGATPDPDEETGISRFWTELSRGRPSLILDQGQGLGIVAAGPQVVPAVADFFADARKNPERTQGYFSRLGEAVEMARDQQDINYSLTRLQTVLIESTRHATPEEPWTAPRQPRLNKVQLAEHLVEQVKTVLATRDMAKARN